MSGSWHEENCDCKKCTFYKNHDELCGCAPCYYRERYNHYKTQNSDCTKLQSENDKLKIERENLLKGKWEILGSGDFNKNNKTVYEHDILMDQQDKYFQGRLKTLEADHVSQQIELNSKLASMSEQFEKQESVLENKLIAHLNAEIKTSFGMTLTELFATVGEQNKIMIELETRNGEQLMSALEKIQDEANSKIRKQKSFVIEQQLVIDEKSCENDNLMKEMKKIEAEFDCLRKTHFELEQRVQVSVREKASFSRVHERSAPESGFDNKIPEKEQCFDAHKMSSDHTVCRDVLSLVLVLLSLSCPFVPRNPL